VLSAGTGRAPLASHAGCRDKEGGCLY